LHPQVYPAPHQTAAEGIRQALPAPGIDISGLKFNGCLVNQSGKLRHKFFPNTADGFAHLAERLTKQGTPRARLHGGRPRSG
jgi:hypothetical protein